MKFSKLIYMGILPLIVSSTLIYADKIHKGPLVKQEMRNPGLDAQVPIVPMVKHKNAVSYTVTSLPTYATLYYDGVKIEKTGFTLSDPSKVTIDPEDGDVTSLMSYTRTDASGHVSEPRNIIMRFLDLELSGSVFHDSDGDGKVDGEKISNLDGEPLFITLINRHGEVVSSKAVSEDGTYSFKNRDGVQPQKKYALVISTKPNVLNALLPDRWAASGENINSLKKGKDGHNDGAIVVSVLEKDIKEIDFGLDIRPVAVDKREKLQLNPGGETRVVVPKLEGSDEENGKSVRYFLTSLPKNAKLYENGKQITKAGVELKKIERLTVDPQNGDQEVSFTYVTADNAGVTSFPATVTLPFKGLKISGNVLLDGDGDERVNGQALSSVEGQALYVTLLNDRNIVLASKAVDADGHFDFNGTEGVEPESTYRLVLSSKRSARRALLPEKWTCSGEGIMTDGKHKEKKADGIVTVRIDRKDLSHVDFGLNQKPEAGEIILAAQLNPGAESQVPVPALDGKDLESSETLLYTVTTLPDNALLFYDGKKITKVPFDLMDPSKLSVDPDNGALTVHFNYKVTDPEKVSSETASVTLPFDELTLSGHIFNDGKRDGNVSGPTLSKADGQQLFVLLIDKNKGLLSSQKVKRDGSYLFSGKEGVKPDTSYTLALATEAKIEAIGLPQGWNNTDERINSLPSVKENALDGRIEVNVAQQNITDIDFGINQKPKAEHKETKPQLNPGLDTQVAVPSLSGEDRESGKTLIYSIASLPTLGHLYYNGEQIKKIGFVIENESNLTVDPDNSDLIVFFTYTVTDEAGVVSDPARVSMPFSGLHIAGRIVNDGNGDAKVKGKPIKVPAKLHPYATLLDGEGKILSTTPLTRDAAYFFDGSDGVRPHANFTVVVSLEANATIPVLPAGWVESGASGNEHNASEDRYNGGRLTVYVDEKSLDAVNFGINKKPTADPKTVRSQINPGGRTKVPVPTLSGDDRESGKNLRYRIKTLPQNASLYSRNKAVTLNDLVDPRSLSLDPEDGSQKVVFTYVSVDPENIESDPVTVTMSFSGLSISGRVLEDFIIDGQVDSVITIADDKVKLYVTLLNEEGGVISSVPVKPDGSYLFDPTQGVNANTGYRLILSVDANASSSKLPPGWNHADGENVNSLGKGNDGKADGIIDVQVREHNLEKVDFGLNYLIQ